MKWHKIFSGLVVFCSSVLLVPALFGSSLNSEVVLDDHSQSVLVRLYDDFIPRVKNAISDDELLEELERAHPLIEILKSASILKPVLSDHAFSEVKKISLLVEDLCAPQDCIVLGLGRSPTPIITYLKVKHAQYAWNLPLSQFKRRHKNGYFPITSEEKEKLFRHFDHYFPKDIENKKILVLDYADTGLSLASAKGYIHDYLLQKFHHNPPSINVVGMTLTRSKNRVSPEIECQIRLDSQESGAPQVLARAFFDQEFDQFSEYEGFDVENDSSPTGENPEHNLFFLEMIDHHYHDLHCPKPISVAAHEIQFIPGIDPGSKEAKLRKIYHLGYIKRSDIFTRILEHLHVEDGDIEARVAAAHSVVEAARVSFFLNDQDTELRDRNSRYLLETYLRVLGDPHLQVRVDPLARLGHINNSLEVSVWSKELVRRAVLNISVPSEEDVDYDNIQDFYEEFYDLYVDAIKYMSFAPKEILELERQLQSSSDPFKKRFAQHLAWRFSALFVTK